MTATNGTRQRGALVIGATSGLGAAVVRQLGQEFNAVHLTYNDRRDEASAAADRLSADGVKTSVHQLVLPDPGIGGAIIRHIFSAVGPVDTVVNCAVRNEVGVATISNADAFKRVIDANVLGAYQVNAVAAQAMAASGGGTIVNVSSILTRRYIAGAIGYITSKAAIEAMTKGFAHEWSPLGVRFVTVAPGPIKDTRLLDTVPEAVVRQVLGSNWEEKLSEPEDIASVITALVGPSMRAVNGEVIVVDEGVSL